MKMRGDLKSKQEDIQLRRHLDVLIKRKIGNSFYGKRVCVLVRS